VKGCYKISKNQTSLISVKKIEGENDTDFTIVYCIRE